MVPEPDVVNGHLVLDYILVAWCILCRKGLLLNPVQSKSLSGKLDIILDVGRLPSQLVGLHLKALYQGGEDTPDDDGSHYPSHDAIEGPPKVAPQYRNQNDPHKNDYYYQKNPLCRKLGMHIGIASSKDHSPCGEDQLPDAKPVTPGKKAQDSYDQSTNMG
ncbi:hypothetical protein ES703_101028 [subsurface metagenome]